MMCNFLSFVMKDWIFSLPFEKKILSSSFFSHPKTDNIEDQVWNPTKWNRLIITSSLFKINKSQYLKEQKWVE
jgi:hypothetical protein